MSLTAHEKLSMFVNLKKGDTILTGRFKNSPKTVKSFGTDDKNQPTVNGSPALSFRIKKLMPAKAKESTMLLPIEQRLIRLNARRIASDKTASVFPWFMTTGGALAGGSAGAALGRQIGENMSDSRTGRRIGTVAGGILGALGGGYAGYVLAPAFGIEESLGAGPRTGTYGDVMRRGGLLGAMSGAATGGLAGGLEGAVTGGLAGVPLGIGLGALSRYTADRSYGSTPATRRRVVPGEFFGTAPKMSYYREYNPVMDKQAYGVWLGDTFIGRDYRLDPPRYNTEIDPFGKFPIITSGIGGVLGGLIGYNADNNKFFKDDLKTKIRNAAVGAVTGAGLGFAGSNALLLAGKAYGAAHNVAPSIGFMSPFSKVDPVQRQIFLNTAKRITKDPALFGGPGVGGAATEYRNRYPSVTPLSLARYKKIPITDKKSSAFPLLSTLTGATLGGLTGAGIGMHAQSGRFTTPKDRYRNMLIGGVLGAGLGGVGGYYAAPYGRMEEALVAPAMVGTPADAVARGIMTGGFSGGVMSGLQRYAGEAGGYRR